jgi:3'-5' exonuclease
MNSPKNTVYFDIETAGRYPDLKTLEEKDPRAFTLFSKKVERKKGSHASWEGKLNEVYERKAPLLPQYGRIICISAGYLKEEEFIMKSFTGDEKKIINDSWKLFNNISNLGYALCGFNIKKFDIPWLFHKYVSYGLKIPNIINHVGVKPWEMNLIDLFEIWSAVEYPSLDETCYELEVETPKQEMDGSMCHQQFYVGEIAKITRYCELDTQVCYDLYQKIYKQLPQNVK